MKKYASITVAVVIAIVICETALRIYKFYDVNNIDEQKNPSTYINNSKSIFFTEGYGVRNGNSAGALDRPLRSDDKIDERGLLFGDSYSEALQVCDNEVYDNIIEDLYTSRNKRFEIINYGRSGMSTLDELDLYLHFGKKIKHNKVIIQFSKGDFYDNFHSVLKYDENKGIINSNKWTKKGSTLDLYYLARNNSVFFNLLATRLYELKTVLTNIREKNEELEGKHDSPNLMEVNKTREILAWFLHEVNKNNAELILFQIPNFEEKIDSAEVVKSLCNELNITFLDVGDEMFSNADMKDAIYNGFINTKFRTGHMNKVGHKILGHALFNLMNGE